MADPSGPGGTRASDASPTPPASSGAERQLVLAEERTRVAQRRTVLAEQRTYSAWVRTGLAAAASGFAIAKLMPESEPQWLVRALGALFLMVGATMFGLSFRAYRRALHELEASALDRQAPVDVPTWLLGLLTLALLVGSAVGLVLVFRG